MNIGLLIIRICVGLTFAGHGAQKLSGLGGGSGLEKTGNGFHAMGFRPGWLFALVGGMTEIGGGLFLAMGLATPLACAMIMGTMLSAALSVHLKNGFWLANHGYEYTFIFWSVAAGIAFTGSGKYSIDGVFGWTKYSNAWAIGAIVLAIITAGGTEVLRRHNIAADRTHAA